jgi:hypothetical protein
LRKRKQGSSDDTGTLFLCYNLLVYWNKPRRVPLMNSLANTMETIESSLMRMLMDGPDVSLNGSPTVSPRRGNSP